MLTSDTLFQKLVGNNSNITWDIFIEYSNKPDIVQVSYYRVADKKEFILNDEPNTYFSIIDKKITTIDGASLSDGSTFVSPLPMDDYLILITNADFTQETQITSNSNYSPKTFENAYDHSVMLARQNKEKNSRTVRLAVSDTGHELELPPLADGLGKYLYINDKGEAVWATGTTADSSIADEALAQANYNKGLLNDIASDSELSPTEKPNVVQIVDSINTEKPIIMARALTYSISTSAYETAVLALNDYLATLTTWTMWNNYSGTTSVVRSTFNGKFNMVYATRQTVLAAISDESKVLTDNAQSIADGEIVGFYQAEAPTGMSFGDIWIDTDLHTPPTAESIFRYQNEDGGSQPSLEHPTLEWWPTPTNAIGLIYLDAYNAQETANTKIKTYFEPLGSIPTAQAVGDLWVVLDDGNKLYRAESIGANQIIAGEWVSVQDQSIIDNISAIADRPTYAETDSHYTTGATATPTIPVLIAKGWFKAVSLRWDIQTDLKWLKHYEIQISSDNMVWYSLEFDGTDFKDVLDGWSVSTEERVVHNNLPLVDGVGATYYYRVRRVTRADVKSDWSTPVSASTYGITSTVITDDAVTTPKIITGAVKADQIDALAVTTEKLDALAVTAGKIATNTITANEIASGTITADEIAAGAITAEKLEIGIKGTAYYQALAPNLMFLNDTWEDTDTKQGHKAHGQDISTSKGGAGSSVTTFDKTYGGADSSITTFDNTYGNIPAYVGWVKNGLYAGTTLIDGGQIETDTLKSKNYVEGVSGSKFDLASGYIETGSGVFRGDLEAAGGTFKGELQAASGSFSGDISGSNGNFTGDVEIGSDDANRQLSLGSKGLLVKDSNGVVIHDLPNAVIASGHSYLGHLLFSDGTTSGYTVYNSTQTPEKTWTTITCSNMGTTNARGGIFKVFKSGIGSATVNPYSYVFLRPNGSSWSNTAGGLSPEMRWFMNFNSGNANQMSFATIMLCPFDTNYKMQFYTSTVPNSTSRQLTIVQLGVYV